MSEQKPVNPAKPPPSIFILVAIVLLAVCWLLGGCAATKARHAPVTAAAKTGITAATGAVDESVRASERSSKELKAVRSEISTLRGNARRIDFKATRLLKMLDE